MTATESAEGRPLPRVMAVANQKGGVGKTTTTINLGACLAELGFRTLIIDLDPQGNASTGLGIENRGLETSMYHVLMHEVPLENCIEPTSVQEPVRGAGQPRPGRRRDRARARVQPRERGCKRAIEAVLDDYDYVLIDCPPSLGLLTVNGLAAADEVLVPIQCEYYALEGLGQLLRNVDLVKRNLNPTLEVSTIVLRHVRRPHEAGRPGGPGGARPLRRQGRAARSCPARCGSPRRRRSGSRSSRSTRRRAAPSPTATWQRRSVDGSARSGLGKGLGAR